jgi:hypothetical protein
MKVGSRSRGFEESSDRKRGLKPRRCTMERREKPEPHHQSPHELRLWAIVDSLVTDISEKEAYLSFARELIVAQRRTARPGPLGGSPLCRKQGTVPVGDTSTERREGHVADVSPAPAFRGAVQSPFSAETKRVVEKWFRRGLSGHLMWLIGEAIPGKVRIIKSE